MGLILSRFRRKLTSLEELERLEEKIQYIEKYKDETEQRQKLIVGKLLIYSICVYIIAAGLFYFLFFPASLQDRLFYIIPLLVFPIIVIFLKRLISWYYVRRMSKQQDLLHRLKSDKRQIIESVKEKETYKVARTILEKFAPDQLRSNSFAQPMVVKQQKSNSPSKALVQASNGNNVQRVPNVSLSESELRHRITKSSVAALSPVIQRPRPILRSESGFLDRLMENLVGDGPNYRYALICTNCHGHNGMALREEFPFLAFKCCYCSFFNKAKEQRPFSPKLNLDGKDEPKTDSILPDSKSLPAIEYDVQNDESKDCPDESEVPDSDQSEEVGKESSDTLPTAMLEDSSKKEESVS